MKLALCLAGEFAPAPRARVGLGAAPGSSGRHRGGIRREARAGGFLLTEPGGYCKAGEPTVGALPFPHLEIGSQGWMGKDDLNQRSTAKSRCTCSAAGDRCPGSGAAVFGCSRAGLQPCLEREMNPGAGWHSGANEGMSLAQEPPLFGWPAPTCL